MLELSADQKTNHGEFNKTFMPVQKKKLVQVPKKSCMSKNKNGYVSKNDFVKLKTTKEINCHAKTYCRSKNKS
jgi:hypothetical protein